MIVAFMVFTHGGKTVNKIFKKIVSVICLAAIVAGISYIPVKADEAEIGFNYTQKSVYTGKQFVLVLNNAPKKIKWWASSDTNVATVKNGVVTAVGPGVCKIKAKCNDVKYTCVVTVVDPYIKVKSDYMRVGNTATAKVKGEKLKSFSSSDPEVISIDKDGNMTANKKGSAVITAECKSGNTLTLTMNVYENVKIIENPTFDDLAPTTHMSFEELVGNRGEKGYPKAMPTPDTYRITVDLYWKVVMVYTKDNDGNYTIPIRYMLCSPGASSSSTRTGVFKMKSTKVRNSVFRGLSVWAQFWSLIDGATYFHSILYNSSQAKDYTESYNKLGQAVSHGCIRLTVPDARWIYYNIAPGTEVEIRKGSSKDEETKEIREQLVLAPMPSKRPSLDPEDIPWTDNWEIDEVPQDYEFVNYPQGSGK